MLEKAQWRTVSWRRGTKGPLSARFAAVRVLVADWPTQRIATWALAKNSAKVVLVIRMVVNGTTGGQFAPAHPAR